jgi:uncharacterized protein (TIGR00730 family)
MSTEKEKHEKFIKSIPKKFQKEISDGLKFINKHKGIRATVFGSHRVVEGDYFYNDAVLLGEELSKNGYIVLSGGGSGVMKAAAQGCKNEKGVCLGLRAKLLTNEHVNDNFYSSITYFNFLETRKYIMASGSELLIFYPGGLGTLDEFFEYLVQVQLGILQNKKIFCVGKEYWTGLMNWLNGNVVSSNYLINPLVDLKSIIIVSSHAEIISTLIKKI